ncbi:unnamed protein product, partial [marine sediment metagenome]
TFFIDLFGSKGVGIATGIMTLAILIFGEITPKTFAIQNAERVSLKAALPIELLSYILLPFVKLFELISHFTSRLLGSKEEPKLSEDELRTIVTMGVSEGILDKETAELIHNVLEFEGTKVTEIMTHESEILFIKGETNLKDVINFVVKNPHSRYPVYSKNKDNVIGMLDVNDVLKYVKKNRLDVKVRNLVKPLIFIPESKEIDDLLSDFEYKKIPMAIVVDEYGNVSGLVTVEDVLEEIVGDIFDRSKREEL